MCPPLLRTAVYSKRKHSSLKFLIWVEVHYLFFLFPFYNTSKWTDGTGNGVGHNVNQDNGPQRKPSASSTGKHCTLKNKRRRVRVVQTEVSSDKKLTQITIVLSMQAQQWWSPTSKYKTLVLHTGPLVLSDPLCGLKFPFLMGFSFKKTTWFLPKSLFDLHSNWCNIPLDQHISWASRKLDEHVRRSDHLNYV